MDDINYEVKEAIVKLVGIGVIILVGFTILNEVKIATYEEMNNPLNKCKGDINCIKENMILLCEGCPNTISSDDRYIYLTCMCQDGSTQKKYDIKKKRFSEGWEE
jgi:predicted TIM-barrel enzyme